MHWCFCLLKFFGFTLKKKHLRIRARHGVGKDSKPKRQCLGHHRTPDVGKEPGAPQEMRAFVTSQCVAWESHATSLNLNFLVPVYCIVERTK